jgi:hypothetical protein
MPEKSIQKLADEAALRMWSIHPNDLDALGFIHHTKGGEYDNPRAAYYASEIMGVVATALNGTVDESPAAVDDSSGSDRTICLEDGGAWSEQIAYVDGYGFADTLLEGVMFRIEVQRSGDATSLVCNSTDSEDYMSRFTADQQSKWRQEALDVFITDGGTDLTGAVDLYWS